MSDPPRLELANGFVVDGWNREDAAAHRRFSVDPAAARFFGWTVEEAAAAPDQHYRDVVARFRRGWQEETRLSLAIRQPDGGEAVGAVEIRPNGRSGEVSYLVDHAWRGRGLAAAALTVFLAWAKQELGLQRATLSCHTENLASQRVAEKCGFALIERAGDELHYERDL